MINSDSTIMKQGISTWILLLISTLVYSQAIQADSSSIIEYLLQRDFSLYKGIPTEWQNNMEVHGKTDLERSLLFPTDSTFEEVIYVEGRQFFVMQAETDSSIEGINNDREIAIRKGSWTKIEDSLKLKFEQESIYELSAYQKKVYYQLYDPKKIVQLIPLRSRYWREEKYLLINYERGLCLDRPGDFCYR